MHQVELQIFTNDKWEILEIDKETSFPFNIQYYDLNNPTVKKINYSSLVNIPRTKYNNNIFSGIWKIDYNVIDTNFNPLLRTDFRLHVQSNIFQSGYLKLEEITRNYYKIRLYGGVGDMFYILSKAKLKDLNFRGLLSHTINRTTLSISQTNIYGPIPATLTYALTYQGQYENFDNKYVVDSNSQTEVTWSNNKKTYTAPDLNEHERQETNASVGRYFGEYRSYYQKPVISWLQFMRRIIDYLKSNGWNLNFSGDFFDNPNPYVQDLHVLCPNYNVTNNISSNNLEIQQRRWPASGYYSGTSLNQTFFIQFANVLLPNSNYNIIINIPFKILATYIGNSTQHLQVKGADLIITATLYINGVNRGNLFYQEGSSDNEDNFEIKLNTNTVTGKRPQDFPTSNPNYYYERRLNGQPIELASNSPDGYIPESNIYTLERSFNIRTTSSGNANVNIQFNIRGNTNWQRYSNGAVNRIYGAVIEIQENYKLSVATDVDKEIRSDSIVRQNDILKGDFSLLDFLMSYTKIFDLHYIKDPLSNTCDIVSRNDFYSPITIIDWTDKVDRDKEYIIKPSNFNYRYGTFKWPNIGTKYEEKYYSETGREYGSIKFDNGNEFSEEEINYLEGLVFNNCIMATDYSKYYLDRTTSLYKDNKILPYLMDESRSRVESGYILLFKDSIATLNVEGTSLPARLSDDNPTMLNYGYSYTSTKVADVNTYLKMARVLQKNNQVYSLNFGRPSIAYNDDELTYINESEDNGSETLYNRFWRGYLQDRFNSNNKMLSCYVYLKRGDVPHDILRKFIIIDNTLFIIHKIYNYDPTKEQSVLVDLISVQDPQAYISQNI